MSKPIQVIPTPEVSKKIDRLKEQLRTSRAGFCEIALEFVLPLIEAGKMQLVNGKLVFVEPASEAA
jgi:hypothetical protein